MRASMAVLLVLVASLSEARDPKFTGRASPALALADPATGGAAVTLWFRIVGDVGESWYCPRLDVEWPDGTHTMRESDCPPYEDRDPDQRYTWDFTRGFPVGEWKVKACLSKSGKVLTCETVVVHVVGG